MYYNNSIPYFNYNMSRRINNPRRPYPYYNNRIGGFAFPFALGFLSAPLLFGATTPNYPYYNYNNYQYYPTYPVYY